MPGLAGVPSPIVFDHANELIHCLEDMYDCETQA
jgi:hypothetical protein